ncbi:MAG TPA: hypothetical protein VNX21_07950 [Candidatus Thermoplasmatota archaeon]|nr:hypothetical protein [Candidatus Thermoplasmatota archaeon]
MLRVLLALLAVAALAAAAHAPLGDCATGPAGVVRLTTKAGTFYVEDRTAAQAGPLANVWEETNGIRGDAAHSLQRGGVCSFDGRCWGWWCVDDPEVAPDLSLVF